MNSTPNRTAFPTSNGTRTNDLRGKFPKPRISDEHFTELLADYEAEQKELKEKVAALQSELSKTLEATANAEKFMKIVRKYTSFEELTPTLLREFVEKIVIHESEALDGKRRGKLRRQEIEIYYSFVGKVELPD